MERTKNTHEDYVNRDNFWFCGKVIAEPKSRCVHRYLKSAVIIMGKTERDLSHGIYALPSFPVVLVTAGQNIMTAAAFHFYSFKPPSVMVGIRPENLTFELISQKGEFGINIPTKEQLDAVRVCGSVSGRKENKFEKTGLTPQKGKVIDSFLIKECPVNLECRVVHQVNYEGSHKWFIGQIEAVHIKDDYARDKALMYWLGEYREVGKVLMKIERK
jgi:flavin reductase (DIM6/NTAB) family NADH-FMN oxidoreductase RutF